MTVDRRFPPSPRRLALARQAGLTAASPTVVAAVVWVAAIVGLTVLGRAIAARIGGWIAAASSTHATLAPDGLGAGVLELVLPLAGILAIAAALGHIAQTRALWLPRRRLAGAPAPEPHRARRALLDLAGAAIVGGVAFGWLWLAAPALAALWSAGAPLAAAGSLLAGLLATLATAWVALGAVDALVRRADHARDLAMSHADKRADDRLAAADPRWRARRAELARDRTPDLDAAVAGASLLLLGADVAVAIAWDPARRPVPTRTATGRAIRATQLLGLARRHHIAVHRDPVLAAALVERAGPVDELHWPRLAEIIAAIRMP